MSINFLNILGLHVFVYEYITVENVA